MLKWTALQNRVTQGGNRTGEEVCPHGERGGRKLRQKSQGAQRQARPEVRTSWEGTTKLRSEMPAGNKQCVGEEPHARRRSEGRKGAWH